MRIGTGKIDISCAAYKSVVSTNRVEPDSLNALTAVCVNWLQFRYKDALTLKGIFIYCWLKRDGGQGDKGTRRQGEIFIFNSSLLTGNC
ncbi:MAG: hypothetical protein WBA39_17175 [Rivularia sp. (in: cyanobacteria)]